ncbi:MAG: S41 family peptidase [Gemmataceae bacterium]
MSMKRAVSSGLLAIAILASALGRPVQGESPNPAIAKGQTYVLLVGISEYADKQIKPRPKAEADARSLYQLFTDKEYRGVKPENIRLLVGKSDNKDEVANRANFLKAMRWISDVAKPEDTVVFGFVGQGGPLGESGDRRCYFLSDSTFANRDKDAVASEEIEDILKKYKGKRFCVFLDVDFKGFSEEGTGLAISEPTLGKTPYKEFLGDDGSDDHLPQAGRVAFLATNGLNPSLDLEKNGIFTSVIVEGLKGKADKEGYEADGLVTVDELAAYMNKRLPELARQFGKTEKEKEQDHFVIAGPGAHFILTTNPEALPANEKRLAKFEQMVKDGTVKEASQAEEGRVLLERMPILKSKQELRKAYQSLVDGQLDMKAFEEKREAIIASTKLKQTEANLFAMKVLEATEMIREEYVREVNQGQMVGWAIQGLFDFLEEKVPPQMEEKIKDLKSMKLFQLRDLLTEARMTLGKREDLDNHKDLNITLQRMLGKLDPHTTFIDPETKKKFDDDIAGNFTGIGVQIRKDAATNFLLVVTPIKGSPAYKAKIQTGDLITRVFRETENDGTPIDPPEIIDTSKVTINAAIKKILGPPGTKIKVEIQRGKEKPFQVELTRARVEMESVVGAKRKGNDDWEYVIDPQHKVAYVRLTSFARNTYRDLENVIASLKRQGIKGLVLDLRFNPGGLLDVAIKVSDLFVDDGMIVSVRPRGGSLRETRFNGRHEGSLLDFPMVCLVNGYSASGSEIVSAALQDHNRALIMGERSYGKGSVQNIRDFEVIDPKSGDAKKAEIKLTTASFWRPSGKNLNKASTGGKDEEEWGVIPDKMIKLGAKERRDLAEFQRSCEIIESPEMKAKGPKPFKDRQLEAALEYLRGQIKTASRFSEQKAG